MLVLVGVLLVLVGEEEELALVGVVGELALAVVLV